MADNRNLKIRRELVPTVSAYADTFGSPSGEKVLADLEASFGGSCYTRGDPYDTAYKEGQRDVLMRIKRLIGYAGREVEEDEPEAEKEYPWVNDALNL